MHTFSCHLYVAAFFIANPLRKERKMKEEELFRRLRQAENIENNFSKIMHAKTVQEIIDLSLTPDEMLSYFDAVELFGSIEEESIFFGKIVIQKLRDVSSEKKRRSFLI